jgi:hypothetical protein
VCCFNLYFSIEDSGIYAMMFLKYWKSPRTVLRKVFDYTDIPNLRIKFANDLMFVPGNNDMKGRVVEFVDPGHYLFIHIYMYIFYIHNIFLFSQKAGN